MSQPPPTLPSPPQAGGGTRSATDVDETEVAVTAYLGLGSNLGDRTANLRFAIDRIARFPTTTLKAVSSLYETPPWGVIDQPAFLNLCLAIDTRLSPHDLLHNALAIEHDAGRVRQKRWGPRTLDIDILLYGNNIVTEQGLVIPHPKMMERAFVLVPLLEISPDLIIDGRLLRDRLEALDTKEMVNMGAIALPAGKPSEMPS